MMRTITVLIAALSILLSAGFSFGSDCVTVKDETVKKTVGACEIKTQAGRYGKGTFYIDYSGGTLTCGKKALVDGAEIVKQARETCTSFDAQQGVALPYTVSREIVPISNYKDFISVEVTDAGFTGGVHPYAVVKRATYNVKTGDQATLAGLFGKAGADKIEADAKKIFDKKNLAPNYQFDTQSFSLAASADGKVKITFAAPHSIELYRGTTLEVSVTAAPPK
jgi:hypothetical protein